MERWRELCTRLDVCARKLATVLDKQKKSFLVFFYYLLMGVVCLSRTFKYSTTTCLRKMCVSGVAPAGRFSFLYLLLILLENGV